MLEKTIDGAENGIQSSVECLANVKRGTADTTNSGLGTT